MPQPVIPQPLFISGGYKQRPAAEQMLLTLASQAPGLAMQIFQNIQQGPQREAAVAESEQRVATSKAQQKNYQSQVDIRQKEFKAEEAAAAAKAQAIEKAISTSRGILSRDPQNSEQLVQAFELELALSQIPEFDAALIKPLVDSQLPQSEKDKLDLERTRLEMAGLEADIDADEYATGKLIEMGVLGADSPMLPGASKTLQSILDSRAGKAINWGQEGLDFITAQIGRSQGGGLGTDPMTGQLSFTPGSVVSVDEAVNRWRGVLQQYAGDAADREIKRIDSVAWQRTLAKELAIGEVMETLLIKPQMSEQEFQSLLGGAYTETEVREILRAARRRMGQRR